MDGDRMEKKIFSEVLKELCNSIGVSHGVLSGIIGKAQSEVSRRFRENSFTSKEVFDIVNTLGCRIEIIIDDEIAISNDELYEYFNREKTSKKITNKTLSEYIGVTQNTFGSRLKKENFKIDTLIEMFEKMGCKIDVRTDTVNARDREELYEEYYKEPLSEEARLRKNERQREYDKSAESRNAKKAYSKKTYKQYTINLRIKEDADVIEYIEEEKESGNGLVDIIRNLIRERNKAK